jgi:sigma-E factor negative regulatory protein RseC
MVSKKEVTHTGIVKEIQEQGIKVGIVVQSGCASCEIKGSCNMSEQADKELDIECNPLHFKVGQRVMVHLKTAQGMSALFLGYILPFLVLITTMIIATNLTDDEGLVGIFALLSLLPYYFVLYLFKNRIKNKFTYVVNPLN